MRIDCVGVVGVKGVRQVKAQKKRAVMEGDRNSWRLPRLARLAGLAGAEATARCAGRLEPSPLFQAITERCNGRSLVGKSGSGLLQRGSMRFP